MKINDLEHLDLVDQPGFIEGAAFAYASSSSMSSPGLASSDFQAIAIGRSTTMTLAGVKIRAISTPKFSYSSSSNSTSAYARD